MVDTDNKRRTTDNAVFMRASKHLEMTAIYISPESSKNAQSDGLNSYCVFLSLMSILEP